MRNILRRRPKSGKQTRIEQDHNLGTPYYPRIAVEIQGFFRCQYQSFVSAPSQAAVKNLEISNIVSCLGIVSYDMKLGQLPLLGVPPDHSIREDYAIFAIVQCNLICWVLFVYRAGTGQRVNHHPGNRYRDRKKAEPPHDHESPGK